MTRKDYELIAQALYAARCELTQCDNAQDAPRRADMIAAWLCCAGHLAGALHNDNARFDRERFMTACRGE
jgi:hypothetical protein